MIVFCGYGNSDQTVHVPALPGAGDRVQALDVQRHDGGMAANAAAAAARTGADAAFAGVVGTDPLSTAFLDRLAADGVDTAWVSRDGRLTTAIVLVTPDGERSVISQDDDVTEEYVAQVVLRLGAAGGGWLYLDGYRFPWAGPLLAAAPNLRVVVDLDGCERTEAALAALSVAEHAIIGRTQAGWLLGEDPGALAVAHRIHLVVTDGARGWQLYTPAGDTCTGEALSVEAQDATGAGDCFVGCYAAELERGAHPAEAARFASVAAGLSCRHPGARTGQPTRAEVTAHLTKAGSAH
ncbi:carbohydrate kinase family protein [Streptomyces iconiensis]|uniref:Carbohydrate kinase family protein n=1 Tax=Streptomyces iconiensis TaxID=1384038 RepID=A0ABT6ZR03_9ACTN|nr:carbohydrate kinase family protein [Streptomyces iconiensis]MDJ1131483.1 carbohydrate kinase family protein [Streptomyces iconiensis]